MALDPNLVDRQRQDLFHLTNMARADLRAFLWQVKDLPVAEVRNLLIQVMPDLVEPYMQASGELAATWYEDLRRAVGARGAFYASAPTVGVQIGQANAVARWAVDPLVPKETHGVSFDPQTGDEILFVNGMTAPDPEAVLRRLAGSVHRMIFDSARGVVEGNAARDPVRVGYQRMARGNCCAFCGMLASRGAEYSSSASAGGVVGAGSTRTGFDSAGKRASGGVGGGVKARGKMNLGDRYHDDCQCVVMPVFFGTELAAIAAIEEKKFKALYDGAVERASDGAVDLKGTLSAWRTAHGAK